MNTSHSEFLVQLQKKRLTLEKLIDIAQDIECMNQGLSVVLDLQNISFEVPEETLHFLTLISENIKDHSTSNVTDVLKSFDHRVHTSLDKVLDLALIEISRDMDKEEIESNSKKLSKIIEQFKKNVQTTIAMRLLLKERGAEIPIFKCDVPIKTIKERIEKLEKKEDMFRYTIDLKINSMLEEISLFLNDSSLPKKMKEEIVKVHEELCEKKEHLRSGKEFSGMTLTLELIELGTNDKEDEHQKIEKEDASNNITQELISKPNNIFKRLSIWIATPLEVSWKETKYYSDKL